MNITDWKEWLEIIAYALIGLIGKAFLSIVSWVFSTEGFIVILLVLILSELGGISKQLSRR